VCVVLTVSKVLLIALQPQMYTLSPHLAPLAKMSVSALWAVYLLVSTLCARRSLSRPVASHLDRGTVSVHANAELKRALFKRIGCAVGAYPVIAAAAFFLFLFVRSWRWRWIRLVLFDLWMASVIMPSAYQWWPDDGGGRYAPLTQEIDATADVFGDMPDRVEIVSADDDDLGMGMGMGMMELPARHTARSPFEDDLV
jgi:threonine/homoserine efflux transporter RhtA